jgi:hypothetical protein
VGKNGMSLGGKDGNQYKNEGQSADRGKQPPMLGMSAHKRIGCYSASEGESKLKLQSDSFRC